MKYAMDLSRNLIRNAHTVELFSKRKRKKLLSKLEKDHLDHLVPDHLGPLDLGHPVHQRVDLHVPDHPDHHVLDHLGLRKEDPGEDRLDQRREDHLDQRKEDLGEGHLDQRREDRLGLRKEDLVEGHLELRMKDPGEDRLDQRREGHPDLRKEDHQRGAPRKADHLGQSVDRRNDGALG